VIEKALADWRLKDFDLLFIENVGNLVCPSSYDLGEAAKIMVLSVAEGEEKPLKYPAMFHRSELLIMNKIDLLPYVPFNLAKAHQNAEMVHPGIETIEVSCLTGEGLPKWQCWLEKRLDGSRRSLAAT
jgi:hydrogenase nickel incorporation protein HypB